MSTEPTTRSHPKFFGELSAWLVGGGVLTMALFPLALPLILLTALAALPFLVIPLVGGLVAAVVAAPILVLRRLREVVRVPRRFGRSGHEDARLVSLQEGRTG